MTFIVDTIGHFHFCCCLIKDKFQFPNDNLSYIATEINIYNSETRFVLLHIKHAINLYNYIHFSSGQQQICYCCLKSIKIVWGHRRQLQYFLPLQFIRTVGNLTGKISFSLICLRQGRPM